MLARHRSSHRAPRARSRFRDRRRQARSLGRVGRRRLRAAVRRAGSRGDRKADTAANRPVPPPGASALQARGRDEAAGVSRPERHRRSDGAMSAVRRAAHHRPAAALRDHPAAASGGHPLRGPPRVPLHPDRRPPASRRSSSRRISATRSARWEGDTLVVDVTGFNTNTWLVGVGTFHSEKLRVTERYTPRHARHDHLRSDDGRSRGAHEAVEAVRHAEAACRASASVSTSASRTTRTFSASRSCYRSIRR